ncbi:MAG: hypothetical protein KME45_14710 [Stenomitos rutilans HA7619-LM2]|nr:hypothetical protein [Stenomitos rutilans HA7619-LM2]
MVKGMQWALILALMGTAVGCTKAPQAKPQAESSPPISIAAPINKAKQTAIDVHQKGLEREQLDPQAQPEPSPDQPK